MRRPRKMRLSRQQDVDTAILSPGRFVSAVSLDLTARGRGYPVAPHSLLNQERLHVVGSATAQHEVVFLVPTRIGVSHQPHLTPRERSGYETVGEQGQHPTFGLLNVGRVEREMSVGLRDAARALNILRDAYLRLGGGFGVGLSLVWHRSGCLRRRRSRGATRRKEKHRRNVTYLDDRFGHFGFSLPRRHRRARAREHRRAQDSARSMPRISESLGRFGLPRVTNTRIHRTNRRRMPLCSSAAISGSYRPRSLETASSIGRSTAVMS
jgi:hypothetical protein